MIKTSKFRLYSPSVGKAKKKVGATPQKSIMVERKEDKDILARTPRRPEDPTVMLPAIKNSNPLVLPVSRTPLMEAQPSNTSSQSQQSNAYTGSPSYVTHTPVKSTSSGKKSPLSAPQKATFTIVHKPKLVGLTNTPPNGIVATDGAEETLGKIGYATLAGRSDGKGKVNQDSFFIDTKIEGWQGLGLIGVFDGHGLQGNRVSNFLIANIKGKAKANLRNLRNHIGWVSASARARLSINIRRTVSFTKQHAKEAHLHRFEA
jgi:hypothetical protein